MCTDRWIGCLAILLIIVLQGHVTLAWSNYWTTHVIGGSRVARSVADDHGFYYLMEFYNNCHVFVHPKIKKRSSEPHLDIHQRLINDPRVQRAEQQRVLSRQKRDLIVKRGSVGTPVIFNDEKWSQMWYLNRGNGLDMNVQGAWNLGITGHGIVVTILDDGLEKDHPDLRNNYDPQASYDVNNNDPDPMPRYDYLDSNRHGTRCAGEVAATANNNICTVGVAFRAGVGGVKMLDGDVTDTVEARSLSLNPQHVDIYSASWGPDDDGKTVDGPGELATRAFIEGVTKGRDGKGSIFVWASGNGGKEFDNCNCDGYTNSIWTLSISSATERGEVPWYSEACSSTLATTYSSGAPNEKQIITTDLHRQCTTSHTGTSASAPLAAGICALALEANPSLTWRDMQHIVVRTAKPANLKAKDWAVNGIGRNVSHSFGYGLMDATAMVIMAKKWKTVPTQYKCEVTAPRGNKSIPPRSLTEVLLVVPECARVKFIEHVQANITLSATRRGDLQIKLTSPQNTTSTLLTERQHDESRAGFNHWPFMSVHMWGESPNGTWKLEIHNGGRYFGRATLHEWALIFYGTSTLPDRTEYALYSQRARNNQPRKALVKVSNYSKNGLNTLGVKGKPGASIKPPSVSQAYVTSVQGSPKKSKARGGQHKNGKSTNRLTSKPTMQSLRGLTFSRGSPITVRARTRSTPKPRPGKTVRSTVKPQKQRIVEYSRPSQPLQRGLILMEPAVKPTNIVPVVFQQYPKIQQLYPLYPVYGGAREVDQHSPRAKGLDLLQDEQFDSRILQLSDKANLKEWKLMFYGTETSHEVGEKLDADKNSKKYNIKKPHPDIDKAIESGQNVVDTEGDAWTGRQQVNKISHPEVQGPTTENQTSGACQRLDSHGCLECNETFFLFAGKCLQSCPETTYADHDEDKFGCISCHYSCLTCSGPSDNECTSCHADSKPTSTEVEQFQCARKEFAWKIETTVWYQRVVLIFTVNLIVVALIILWYKCTQGCRQNIKYEELAKMDTHYSNEQLNRSESDSE